MPALRSVCLRANSKTHNMISDKTNHVDYRWYVVRTRPRQERKLVELLEQYKAKSKNILEIYAPTHTTVNVCSNGDERQAPLFAGIVFVLATQKSLMDFMKEHPDSGGVQYERKNERGERTPMRVIPEEQMRAFRDYNENYADKVIVLERPYTDYAFNAKAGEPNEIVRVIDGPLAGCEGYICRFRRERRLVFQVRGFEPGSSLTVSYPNVWDLHVVRLHNTANDRLSVGTEKGRAADILIGFLQGCGYGGRTLPMLYGILERLAVKPSLVSLCKDLHKKGEAALSMRLAQMSGSDAELILNLARYEHDNPGYVRAAWSKLVLRPFLTPTAGVEMENGQAEAEIRHQSFTEIVRRTDITEEVYDPAKENDGSATTTYFAHIGLLPDTGKDGFTLFANWNDFLHEYFLTGGKANEKLVGGTAQNAGEGKTGGSKEKLVESFRNYAPTLYKVLAETGSAVKAVPDFPIGEDTLNVMAITGADLEHAKDELIRTCVSICQEINASAHLAVWRRYLRTVWLHV